MQLTWRSWLLAFGLTLAFELPIVLTSLRRAEADLARRCKIAVCANLLTHPLVWFFFPLLPQAWATKLALSELWAFAAEAWFYATFIAWLSPRRAAVTSLLANATSFGLGWLVVTYWGNWLF